MSPFVLCELDLFKRTERHYYLLLFGLFAFISSAFSDDLLNWPSKRKTTKAFKNKSLGFVWCSKRTSQWLDEFSVRVRRWLFTGSLTSFTHRMVAYPSDIKQRGVYWEVTIDRDLTSMTWIKNKKTKTGGLILWGGKNYFKKLCTGCLLNYSHFGVFST